MGTGGRGWGRGVASAALSIRLTRLKPRDLSRTEEPAKAGTCARDRRALQQIAC